VIALLTLAITFKESDPAVSGNPSIRKLSPRPRPGTQKREGHVPLPKSALCGPAILHHAWRHTPTGHAAGLGLLRLLRHYGLGGEQQARDAGRVL